MNYFNQTVKFAKAADFLKSLQKKWRTDFVLLSMVDDTVTFKKVNQSSFRAIRQRLKKATKEISNQDIKTAIDWARR